MKQLIKYLIVLVFFVRCGYEADQNNQEKFESWLNDHRIPANERLSKFDYHAPNELPVEYGKIEKTIIGDTLTVSFYTKQPVGCLLIGDIEILENLIVLKFGQACSPYEDGMVTEEADLLLTYQIKNGDDLKALPIQIEGLTNLLK